MLFYQRGGENRGQEGNAEEYASSGYHGPPESSSDTLQCYLKGLSQWKLYLSADLALARRCVHFFRRPPN